MVRLRVVKRLQFLKGHFDFNPSMVRLRAPVVSPAAGRVVFQSQYGTIKSYQQPHLYHRAT